MALPMIIFFKKTYVNSDFTVKKNICFNCEVGIDICSWERQWNGFPDWLPPFMKRWISIYVALIQKGNAKRTGLVVWTQFTDTTFRANNSYTINISGHLWKSCIIIVDCLNKEVRIILKKKYLTFSLAVSIWRKITNVF